MKSNSKLALALHALGHLAEAPDRPRTSADIARHNDTNAVVVRRVLGQLREAGIVVSQKGHSGGWLLARPPARITLADVYEVLGDGFATVETGPAAVSSCGVQRILRSRVDDALNEAQDHLLARLRLSTIDELAAHDAQAKDPG